MTSFFLFFIFLTRFFKNEEKLTAIYYRFLLLFCLFLANSVLATSLPYSEWNLANYNGAYATFDNGVVSIVNGGSDYWHVQLTRHNIELQTGKTYEVKFFLQGVSARRTIEVRIGRNGFPYDAFAEFGEITATPNGRTITETFTMQSGNVNNARFEFNLGKTAGIIYIADISLKCLDCDISNPNINDNGSPLSTNDFGYVVIADTVDFRDYSMALGDIFGAKLELGADSKMYGNVDVSDECFLRERAKIDGILRYKTPCTEQNNVFAKAKKKDALLKPIVNTNPTINVGISPVSVGLDQSIILPPGNYGTFYANARSNVRLSSGTYNFQNFYTEPDVSLSFDLSSGPISVGVLNNIRFGDRNNFSITGGNPSEIIWNIAGKKVDLGTDGLYFGRIFAPSAYVRIPSRSHLVGGIYARKFIIEPQSTVSEEPRAKEISHSEEHFGPFFEPRIFRYRSQIPTSISSVEIFAYAENVQIQINGTNSSIANLPSANEKTNITLSRNKIPGFPSEAFTSNYVFNFTKNSNYRIYWNPQTTCKQGCDGASAVTALGDFTKALDIAKTTGREINMAGGVWDVTETYNDGIVPWNIGFELVGYTGSIWDLPSVSGMPTIFLGETSHIQIIGKSPRSLTGFWIGNGFNKEQGGSIASDSQRLKMKNILLSGHKSEKDGGALYSSDTIEMYNVHFKNNTSNGSGGALYVEDILKMQNVIFNKNVTNGNGGAIYSNGNVFAQNVIFSQNEANKEGGAWFAHSGTIKMTNATVFDNNGKQGYSAIGGNADGLVYNSILWKNIKASCTTDKCKKEISPTLSINYSIAETNYEGDGNLVGDPKFYDESKPEGGNDFMSMTAGLTLQDTSPAIGTGQKDSFVLETDILNIARPEKLDLGAYAWYDLNSDYILGQLIYGKFRATPARYPVFKKLGDIYDIFEKGNGGYARVLRKKIPISKVKDINKIEIEFTLISQDGKAYEIPPVIVPFYKSEENENYAFFQTLVKNPSEKDYNPEQHGRFLIFTSDYQKCGIYADIQVLPIISEKDKLKGVVISW